MNHWTTGIAAAGLAAAGLAAAPALMAQADMSGPQPGEYRATVTLQAIDMPGAPPQVANMMREMMSREFTYCLSPDDVDEGYREMVDQSQQGDCSYERFDVSGGEIDALVSCRQDGRDITMRLNGTGTATGSDMTMTMSGDMGMGPSDITMRIIHERIGTCS